MMDDDITHDTLKVNINAGLSTDFNRARKQIDLTYKQALEGAMAHFILIARMNLDDRKTLYALHTKYTTSEEMPPETEPNTVRFDDAISQRFTALCKKNGYTLAQGGNIAISYMLHIDALSPKDNAAIAAILKPYIKNDQSIAP